MVNNTKPSQTLSWESARRQIDGGLLTILMPAHNLASSIAANVREVHALFSGQVPFEIIVIDDGSTDGTAEALRALEPEIPELRVQVMTHNQGKGEALRNGFEASRGSHIAFLDADLDLSPRLLTHFFEIMESERADIVIGSKRHRDSVLYYPWSRRLFSTIYYFLIKAMFGMPIHDTQTGMKLFRREALTYILARMLVKHFAFDVEILAIAHEKGYRIAEAPVALDFKSKWGGVRLSTVRRILHDTMAVFYRLRLLKYYRSIRDTPVSKPPPLVSIVIAYPAETEYLRESLVHVARQTYRSFEVILLPDEEAGHPWAQGIREIATGRLRPAEKRNIGIQQARGEITVFLDDDAFPIENWLDRAVGYFSNPDVAAVGGPAVTPGTDTYLAQVSGRIYANRLVSGGYTYRYAPDRVREVDDYPSCNLFVRTETLRQLKGFRTDFWPGEDTYLCMELVYTLHKKIIYEPRALVYHHRRKIFLPHLRQIGRYGRHRGYFARHFPATSRRLGYMLPSLFVIGVAGGAVLSFLWPWIRPAYAGALLLYVALTLLFALSRHPLTWVLTWLGIMATHVVYGAQFIVGFLTGRLPGEVRPFDHPSEETPA